MDIRTGDLYPSLADALKAGVPRRDIVEVSGDQRAIRRLQRAARRASRERVSRVEARRRRRRQQEKASRKRNR